MGEDTKVCPSCAETIKAAATICRFCQFNLETGKHPSAPGGGEDIAKSAGMRMLIPVGRSGWAIAAGYTGFFSLLMFPAPLGLIVSIIAAVQLRKNPEIHGWGRTWFGLIAGGLGTILLLIMLVSTAAN